MMGNFPQVLNWNWLFLKLNPVQLQLAVSSLRSLPESVFVRNNSKVTILHCISRNALISLRWCVK